MWRQSANHSHSLRWEEKTAPWEFQTKLLHYFFLIHNESNLHFTDPHRTQTQRSPKARSPTACTHITTRSQTNHSQMDVLTAHLNRDSSRDSFKGLVALEIIIDHPIGFPTNKIISHPDSCDQRLIVAFPTHLLFQKILSSARYCPSSSWV